MVLPNEAFFIDDDPNWSMDGYIAARAPWSELRFSYRPLTIADRQMLVHRIDQIEPGAQIALYAKMLAKQLKSWSAPEPITSENVERLAWPLFDRLVGVVLLGVIGCDADPGWSTRPQVDDGKAIEEQLLGS